MLVRPGAQPATRNRRLAWLTASLILIGLLGIPAQAQTVNKSVLAVYATRRDGSAVVMSDPLFQKIIGQGLNGRLDYYAEYLDVARFSEPDYQRTLRALLRTKYAGRKFDLFLAIGDPALGFLRQYRDDVGLRNAPIVFGVAARPRPLPNSTGFITPLKMKLTLDSALALQPDTEHVVVVSGASQADGYYETAAREEFRPLESAVDFTYLTGLPMQELAEKVRVLPQHTIIFYALHVPERGRRRHHPAGRAGSAQPDCQRSGLQLAHDDHRARRGRRASIQPGGTRHPPRRARAACASG